jgi:hypothetical protein
MLQLRKNEWQLKFHLKKNSCVALYIFEGYEMAADSRQELAEVGRTKASESLEMH